MVVADCPEKLVTAVIRLETREFVNECERIKIPQNLNKSKTIIFKKGNRSISRRPRLITILNRNNNERQCYCELSC